MTLKAIAARTVRTPQQTGAASLSLKSGERVNEAAVAEQSYAFADAMLAERVK